MYRCRVWEVHGLIHTWSHKLVHIVLQICFICVILQAALYQTNFRPVPLEEFLKVGLTIYDKSMEIVRSIRKGADLGGKDPDHVVELCHEVFS